MFSHKQVYIHTGLYMTRNDTQITQFERERLEVLTTALNEVQRAWHWGSLSDVDVVIKSLPHPGSIVRLRDNRRQRETLEWVAEYLERMRQQEHAMFFRRCAAELET